MRLGRIGQRKQRTAQAFDEIRHELQALDTQFRATLTDTLTEMRATGATAVDQARADLGAREEQLMEVLRQVGRSYELLAEHINADKLERRALIDALAGAVRTVSGAVPRTHLIGGSLFGGKGDDDTIDLTTAPADAAGNAAPAVEVRCRFGDTWADGFEIAEVVDDGDCLRYRLRRRSDGALLPALFDAQHVRRADRRTVEDAEPARPWHGPPR